MKAIASGLHTYPKIVAILKRHLKPHADNHEYREFAARMEHLFRAHVINVVRKTHNIVELTICAPLAAKHFKPGQFYRLQNFETLAPRIGHTLLQMEPLALVTAECNRQDGSLTFLVHENNATASLCALLKPGELVSLMGPTGVRAKLPTQPETVLIIGNQSSFAFLRSYGPLLRNAGHRVIYMGQFADKHEVYCQAQLEQAADTIFWFTKGGDGIESTRTSDASFLHTDVMTALIADASGKLADSHPALILNTVDRIFIVGDADLLRRFQAARKTALKPYLVKNPKVFGSVYGNMQCMLKGVCAQCLQWQIDPETGERTKAVFACSWQDQPLEMIDIDHIDARQFQNRLHEAMSKWWVDYLFAEYPVMRV